MCCFPLLHRLVANGDFKLSLRQAHEVASKYRKQHINTPFRSEKSCTLVYVPLHEYASSGCTKHVYKGEMHDPFHLCQL